ncbi:MAG TPA: hypothetical protein VIB47_05230 [Dehalococcoidia bacterium]|jgi:hypothetical protein
MSLYGINKVCHLTQVDPAFRERMKTDPAGALAGLPLTAEEREAILRGDVAQLRRWGAHTFLLSRLPRFDSLGLSREEYIERMRVLLAEGYR